MLVTQQQRAVVIVLVWMGLFALNAVFLLAPRAAHAQPPEERRFVKPPPGYKPPEPTAGAMHWESIRVASSPNSVLAHCEVILLSLKFRGRWGGNTCSGRRNDANFLVVLTPQVWRRGDRPVIEGSDALIVT